MINVTLALVLAATSFADQESKPIPKDSVEVEARGCLKGRVFTGTGRDETETSARGPDVAGRHFRVTGPREVMDLVKKHNGHLVEVVGVVRKSALGDEGIGMKVGGNTRVVIGAPGGDPTRMNTRAASAGVAAMDVVALRYLSDRCPLQ
jgi:hypothetical protein